MVEFPKTPWFPLRTERLLLREFRPGDLDAIQAYAEDPEVVRYMAWGPNSRELTAKVLGGWLEAQKGWPRASVDLAVELVEAGALIGAVRLTVRDLENRAADFGYTYNRAHWGKGYATEAARAVVGAAFGQLGLHRVYARCDGANAASYGVMEKLGMRREGVFLKDTLVRGEWRDTVTYALLDAEWAARQE